MGVVPVVVQRGDPDRGHQEGWGNQRGHLKREENGETEARKAISAYPQTILFEVLWQLLL